MAEAEPGAAGGYVAFISYSHKDAKVGRWLHRKLEGYRLPKRLAGTEGEDGEVPARLTPIFRDRDELPAAGDLSEKVRAALAVSKNLIVVCSPHSAASPWVAKEIATFRELHPGRPIFTAIVEGEPDQCFSPALREGGVEPLAADLRKEGDGRRLGLLKLVAGLSGIGLDALVQRDAARRIRRVTYVTATAVAAMLAMALLTAIALSARAEAERQRAEAEGLVEFMLTDLRNRLRTVGRIDIMEAVNRRALARYGGHDELGSLAGEALSRRARILHALGEDELTLGHTENASSVFAEAARATAEQLGRDPGNLERQLNHARSIYWIGRVHELQSEWPQAQHQYALFAAATDKLIAAAPANADYMKEVGWSRIDLGNIQLNGTRDYALAQRHYQDAIRWFRHAMEARPDDDTAQVLANAYGWLADSFYMRRLYPASLAARWQQYEINRRLAVKFPRGADEAYRLATTERALARSLAKTGNLVDGRARLDRALTAAHRLTEQDPRNGEWLFLRASIDCDFLFTSLRPSAESTRISLATDLKQTVAALRAENNPRVSDLSNCLKALPAGHSLAIVGEAK